MASRPGVDAYFLTVASLVATRSTCLRRAVGCVLVDERNHVLATGYNGVAPGHPHCNQAVAGAPVYRERTLAELSATAHLADAAKFIKEEPLTYPNACPGAQAPSGTQLDACAAIHAEANALIQCRNPYAIHAAYMTAEPCVSCTKLLLVTGCRRVVALGAYAGSGRELWKGEGRTWELPGWLDHEAALAALGSASGLIKRVQEATLSRVSGSK